MKKTTVTRTSLPPFEEFCAQIRPLWDSRILTNMGSQHEAFRAALEQYLEVPHAVPFTNGHLALEAALRALRLPAGAEVVTAGAGPGMLCRHALRGCGPRAGGPEPCRPGAVPAPLRRPAGRRGGPYL